MPEWFEHLPDALKAALVTGSVQLCTGTLTAFVAWYALSSWRRSALGSREIEIAEECLKTVWNIDKSINNMRFWLIPVNIDHYKENPKVVSNYKESFEAADRAIKVIFKNIADLKDKLALAELYLGKLPRTKLNNTSRFFKKTEYSITEEYDEILGQLSVALININPSIIDKIISGNEDYNKYYEYADMFNGFFYEYERDDYSYRLILVKTSFERHLKKILKRKKSLFGFTEASDNIIEDYFIKRYAPVTKNKKPYRRYVNNKGDLIG